jgi:hypothetical protein
MWGYLSEFWSNITESVASTTENLIEYPVSFFQNIGNSVVGALGSLFDNFLHQFNDIIIFFSFSINRLGIIFDNLSIPFVYVFNFFKNILQYGLGSAETPEVIYEWSENVLGIFDSIPHWSVFGSVIGFGFTILGGLAIFKLLTRL